MSVVSTRIDSGIAVVTIDSPPVNMGNNQLRTELLAAFTALRDGSPIEGVVLTSGRAHFYSGSDIKEFDGDVKPPSLPDVIRVIEGLDVPVVAALNGFTLGGGLEVAIGCDARIAEPNAKLGLPETTLGMLPGAGGTVRLPRLVGVAKAIEMIASGKHISAQDALDSGLVDALVPAEELLTAAVALARSAPKRHARLLDAPTDPASMVEEAIARGSHKGRARPNVLAAMDLVQSGITQDSELALTAERAAFDTFRLSQEARNLRYLFFGKRAAAKRLTEGLAEGTEPREVATVGIAGAGTMGASIAGLCLSVGLSVVLFDLNAEVLQRATSMLAEREKSARRWGEFLATPKLDELAGVDLVIDAVFEDLTVKTELLGSLETVVGERVVLASNTSYLDLDLIADSLAHPERLAGLHFFNPADRNPLVEVVRTATSDDETLSTLASLVRRLGKTGIASRVGEGFVGNRVYADYRSQAEFLVEDGAAPEQVDAAMVSFGLAIGPFAVGDMSGLDIAWARRKRLAATRDPEQRYVTIADTLCETGRLGKKTGAGWYAYTEGASRGIPDAAVATIIDEARAAKGISPREIPVDEIQQRIVCSMLLAAASVVEAGVARNAVDVDVALTEGFAFPAWTGGPVRYAATRPEQWVIEGLGRVYESDPVSFAAAQPAAEGRLPDGVRDIMTAVR